MNFEFQPSSPSSSNDNRNYGNDSDVSSSSSSSISFQHDHGGVRNSNSKSAHDADHIYQIRTALHFAIGKLCRAEERADSLCASTNTTSNATATANVTAFNHDQHNVANAANDHDIGHEATAKPPSIMSQEALTALTDLTFHYATTLLANDLVCFCHHAHRKTVKVDDVLLAVRKDVDGIGADLQRSLRQKGMSSPDSATMDSRRHPSLLAVKHDHGNCIDGGSSSSSNSDGSVEELIHLTPERRTELCLKEQRERQRQQTLLPKPTASGSGTEKSATSREKLISKASEMKVKEKLTTSKNRLSRGRRNRHSGGDHGSSSSGSSSSSDEVEFQVDWTTTKTNAGDDTSSSAKGKNKNEKRRLLLDDCSDDDDYDSDIHDHDNESLVVKHPRFGKNNVDNIAPKFGNKSIRSNETNKDESVSDNEVLLAHRSSCDSRRSKPITNNDATRKKMISLSRSGDSNSASATTIRGRRRNQTIRRRNKIKAACVEDKTCSSRSGTYDVDITPQNRVNENSAHKTKQTKTTSILTDSVLAKKRKSAANKTSYRHSTDGGDLIDTDDDDDDEKDDAGNGKKCKKNLAYNGNNGDNADSTKLNVTVSALKKDSFSAASASASASLSVNEDMVIDLADDDDNDDDDED